MTFIPKYTGFTKGKFVKLTKPYHVTRGHYTSDHIFRIISDAPETNKFDLIDDEGYTIIGVDIKIIIPTTDTFAKVNK